MSFKENFSNKTEKTETKTPLKLKKAVDKIINMFCESFAVDGLEQIKKYKTEHPDEKFVIASSHTSNLDVDGAIKALGDDFDIIISMESVLADSKKPRYWGHQAIMKYIGKDNFLPIKYKEGKQGKQASFDPDDFSKISEKMSEGKTPWIAISPMSLDGTMKQAGVGAVYTAIKNKATIIPTAFEIGGDLKALEGTKELLGGLVKRPNTLYHIGQPITPPEIDISVIDNIFNKRKNEEEISADEKKSFSEAVKNLKDFANQVGKNISELLPERQRGFYK